MPKALGLYQEAVGFQPNFPAAWRNIGSLARKMGNSKLALEAAQNLQKQLDPEVDTWWLAVALSDEGDARNALGNNRTALEKYRQARALLSQLAQIEPGNWDLQRDLSVSYERVGDMHLKSGDNGAALKAYQESLAIRKKLAELDPDMVEWQTDSVVSYFKLAQILEDRQKDLLTDALAILYRLHRENRLDYEKQQWIGMLEELLQRRKFGADKR
ncbi:hypothetical protein [Nitrosomonas sp.]|uniref:hypothetical protein n=1 Tax=Nitrosomonas sp. TaxID=42353 RepID=UPI001E01DFC8|nr:hypothetical protein [Nitrosomonas sp.]MBX3616394.1 hypothetical protein [Nitrosomonas sp.]